MLSESSRIAHQLLARASARIDGTFLPPKASNPAEPSVSDVPSDDTRLVQAALGGDKDAFGCLVQRYQDRLFNTLVRVLGSRDDAQDAVQDAFVQAFVKLDTFRGDAKFTTWLYRIALNLALSQRRRRRPTESLDAAKDCGGEEPVAQHPTAAEDLMQHERAAVLQQALLKLNDGHRQILVLRELEGCSYETIADILQMPVGTVRSRLFRARMQLKELLQHLLPEEMTKDATRVTKD